MYEVSLWDLDLAEWVRLRPRLVLEHAVGRGDDELRGHQCASTELASIVNNCHYPGVLVFLWTRFPLEMLEDGKEE